MTTTLPLWVPLVVAILGLIGTAGGAIAGVVITQRLSDRRENTAWERELQRERERWTREDLNRTFEQRRAAYVEFYESLAEMAGTVLNHEMGTSKGDELPNKWYLPTFLKLQHLQMYGSKDVSGIATTAYGTCVQWGNRAERGMVMEDGRFYGGNEQFDEEMELLRTAIRRDLGVGRYTDDVDA